MKFGDRLKKQKMIKVSLIIFSFFAILSLFVSILLLLFGNYNVNARSIFENLVIFSIASIFVILLLLAFQWYSTQFPTQSSLLYNQVKVGSISGAVFIISVVWLNWNNVKFLIHTKSESVAETLAFLCMLSFMVGITLILISTDNKKQIGGHKEKIPNHLPFFGIKSSGNIHKQVSMVIEQELENQNQSENFNRTPLEETKIRPYQYLPPTITSYGAKTLSFVAIDPSKVPSGNKYGSISDAQNKKEEDSQSDYKNNSHPFSRRSQENNESKFLAEIQEGSKELCKRMKEHDKKKRINSEQIKAYKAYMKREEEKRIEKEKAEKAAAAAAPAQNNLFSLSSGNQAKPGTGTGVGGTGGAINFSFGNPTTAAGTSNTNANTNTGTASNAAPSANAATPLFSTLGGTTNTNATTNSSMNQNTNSTMNQTTNSSMNQTTNSSMNQTTNSAMNQTTNPLTNATGNVTTNANATGNNIFAGGTTTFGSNSSSFMSGTSNPNNMFGSGFGSNSSNPPTGGFSFGGAGTKQPNSQTNAFNMQKSVSNPFAVKT
ncbi:hypothetical protein TRFO_21300 [Tritrichomonas foetus]|uniref:Uncharacterized protein n=1 Tax=Tritrichomonas foetus TaxID=1144522 RepID=A0A1J4KJ38_9EUKA|nr:hypothetical protein TRFO_21300 [Tritrichomonas foetus]|eukprot:OHT09686.1 hypothetical protein TRFO_21300 [Tritrichomonas foetus]